MEPLHYTLPNWANSALDKHKFLCLLSLRTTKCFIASLLYDTICNLNCNSFCSLVLLFNFFSFLLLNTERESLYFIFHFYFFLIFLMFIIFERETDRQRLSREGAERERGTDSEAGSRLWAVSTQHDAGLELTGHEIMTWAIVSCPTDWATQAPQFIFHFY